MPADKDIIVGLDVGSCAVRIAVGQRLNEEDAKPQIIGIAEAPAEGINRGVITSIEEAVSSISSCLEKTERLTGVPVEKVWAGISGTHITSQESRGVVAVSKPNGEIVEPDVERAIEAARTVATPPNYEILHVIPKSFTIDGQSGIKDPIGMNGVRLEVTTQIIQGVSAQIKSLTKAIYRTGVDIEDVVLSILATAEAVLTGRQRQLGTAVINIGGSTTSLAVFEEGDLLSVNILPIGSEHITSDFAIGLRISIDAAEKIKLEYGSALPKIFNKHDEINIGEFNGSESNFISRKYISEIIEARAEEIFDKIDAELKKIDRSGMLPGGVVITGGGAKLDGLIEVSKRKLRLPSALGYPVGLTSTVNKVNDLGFATALGLVLWGEQLQGSRQGNFRNFLNLKPLKSVTKKFKKLFRL